MAKKKEPQYKASNGTLKLLWDGKLWTVDSNLRHYPAEFVSVYGAWLVSDQVSDQVSGQVSGQPTDQPTDQVTENNDIEVNNG